MRPKYLNPRPIDTEQDMGLDSINQTVRQGLDNDWTEHCQYELDDRRGYVKYPHVSLYGRSGDTLTSEPNIQYRLYDSSINTLNLSTHDNLTFINCVINTVQKGDNSRVTLRDCKVLEIKDNKTCTILIDNCDISNLVVSNNTDCQIHFQDGSKLTAYANTSRGIPTDPYSERFGENKPDVSSGAKNQSSKCSLISNNTRCKVRLEGITATTGKIITGNTDCDFWLKRFTSTTGEYTFDGNTGCHARIEDSKFNGNDWVVNNDTSCEYVSKNSQYQNSHGFRGGELTFFMKGDTMQQNKCFALSDSHVATHECTVGGDIICEMNKTQLFSNDSEYNAGTVISQSTDCHFNFVKGKCNSGDTNFKDTNCRYDFNETEIQASTKNFKMDNCSAKTYDCKVNASDKNFEGTGMVCLVKSQVTASTINIEGQYKTIAMESSVIKANDGLKGTAEKFIARRASVASGSHPFNGFSAEHADMEASTFVGTSLYNGSGRTYQRANTWAGPCKWSNIDEMHETGVTYASTVQFNSVNTWSVKNKYVSTVEVSDTSHFNHEKATFSSTVSLSNTRSDIDFSTLAAPISLTNSFMVAKNTTASIIDAASSTVALQNSTAGVLNLAGCAADTFMGSVGVINVDGGSTAKVHGTGATINSPGKSGIVSGSGTVLEVSGTNYKRSVGGNYYLWINGDYHERVKGNSLHRIEGSSDWATHMSAIFQAGTTVNVTSPARTPVVWRPGTFAPVSEPSS